MKQVVRIPTRWGAKISGRQFEERAAEAIGRIIMNELQPDFVEPDCPGTVALVGSDHGSLFCPPQQCGKAIVPWGPWATIGWTLLCILVLIVVQIVAADRLHLVSGRHAWQPENR